jgi:hypothetical protein
MLNKPRLAFASGWKMVAVSLAWVLVASATAPTGWYLAGSKPAEYESGVDAQALHDGHPSAYLKAKSPVIDGFGTLMQDFRADQYVGKRMRFSASVRTEGVQNWAGLWMRVDRASGATPLSFDNMQDRPIKGTMDWQNYDVVLDVPEGATGIFFGVLLNGSGSVWLNAVKFEAVGTDAPTTGRNQTPRPDKPTNLDFEK